MLKPEVIANLKEITPEEREILSGQSEINRNIYMRGGGNTVNSQKLLELGKLITVRKHTRFIDFPEHTHDYVELVYMLSGQTVHIVDGKKIVLKQGELLFLGQNSRHAIEKAGENDIALNFIILPQFFGSTLALLGDDDTPLKRFLIDCLCGDGDNNYYLHYKVSDITEIQNSVENLLLTVTGSAPNKRKLGQMTMALLFMQLMGRTENLEVKSREDTDFLKILNYIETNYASGTLAKAAEGLHYDISRVSREIQRKTGKTYTSLVQEKRLSQAAFLLKYTGRRVSDISVAVGYENVSYFHRIFAERYGVSPKKYRENAKLQEKTLFQQNRTFDF